MSEASDKDASDKDASDKDASKNINEVVGRFEDRATFTRVVETLKEAGFAHADLSVLDTHESLEASAEESEIWKEQLSSLVGEAKYIRPLTAAGLIALAAGPVGALIAGGIAAGVTGYALKDLLAQVAAAPHTENFKRALEHGAVLLWVRVRDESAENFVRAIMSQEGAKDIHLLGRPPSDKDQDDPQI